MHYHGNSEPREVLVLLVENHVDLAEGLIPILEEAGYRVRWVKSGAAAYQALAAEAGSSEEREARPDVVLLDLLLSDMSGADVIRRLRQSGREVPPVIVTSAMAPKFVAEEARSIAAFDVVSKPYLSDVLLHSLERAVLSTGSPRLPL